MRCAISSIRACADRAEVYWTCVGSSLTLDPTYEEAKEEEAMRKGSITAGLTAGIFGLSLVLGAGTPRAQSEPKYGGTLEIGTVYVTLSALSFDPADWNWKLNHDTGNYLEQLFAADLTKSKKNGGK